MSKIKMLAGWSPPSEASLSLATHLLPIRVVVPLCTSAPRVFGCPNFFSIKAPVSLDETALITSF